MSRCATCLLTQPLARAESWSLLLRSWSGVPPGCTLSAEMPRLLAEVAHRGVQVSRLSPQHPSEALQALQGHGEEESPGHTWGPCPRGSCACTKRMLSMSWRLPWPNRSPGGVNSGKERETYFNNIRKTCLGFKWVNIPVQNKWLWSPWAFLGRILSRAS